MKLPSSRCASSSSRPSAPVTSSSARRARMSSRRLSIGLLHGIKLALEKRRRSRRKWADEPLFQLPQLVQRHFTDLPPHDHINVDLRLRQPQPTIEKLDPGLKTMRRALFFRAQYLEQIVYDLARM